MNDKISEKCKITRETIENLKDQKFIMNDKLFREQIDELGFGNCEMNELELKTISACIDMHMKIELEQFGSEIKNKSSKAKTDDSEEKLLSLENQLQIEGEKTRTNI